MAKSCTQYTSAAIFVLSAAVAALGCNSETVDLTLRLQPGDSRTVVVEQKASTTMEISGTSFSADSDSEITFKVQVEQVAEDGSPTLAVRYARYRMVESAGDAGAAILESFRNASDRTPLEEMARTLEKQTFSVTLTPKGRVQSVDEMEDLLAAIEAIDWEGFKMMQMAPDEASKDDLKSGFLKQHGEDATIAMMEEIFGMLPPEPVKRRDAWRSPQISDPRIDALMDGTLSLDRCEDGICTASLDATLAPIPGESDTAFAGERRGTVTIDANTGLCVRQVIDDDLSLAKPNEMISGMEMKVHKVIDVLDR